MKILNDDDVVVIDFIEFVTDKPEELVKLFTKMGFAYQGTLALRPIFVYSQGAVTFLIHSADSGAALSFFKQHGVSISSVGFKVKNEVMYLNRAKTFGYQLVSPALATLEEFSGIVGVGGSLIYLTTENNNLKHFIKDERTVDANSNNSIAKKVGFLDIDHVAMNVYSGETREWERFFNQIFGFVEIEDFEINGGYTRFTTKAFGILSQNIKLVISESDDDKSQINEYLRKYNGQGIQHVAFSTNDIYQTVEALRASNLDFMHIPDTYYSKVNERLPFHQEDVAKLNQLKILIDGKSKDEILLQIFTKCLVDPIFFEVIQRKGNDGFGAGNITALFESVEQDQLTRKVL